MEICINLRRCFLSLLFLSLFVKFKFVKVHTNIYLEKKKQENIWKIEKLREKNVEKLGNKSSPIRMALNNCVLIVFIYSSSYLAAAPLLPAVLAFFSSLSPSKIREKKHDHQKHNQSKIHPHHGWHARSVLSVSPPRIPPPAPPIYTPRGRESEGGI